MIRVFNYCIVWDGDEREMASFVWELSTIVIFSRLVSSGVLTCFVTQPSQEIQCMEHGIAFGEIVVPGL